MDLWNPTLLSDGTWLLGSLEIPHYATGAYLGGFPGGNYKYTR